MMDGEGLYIVPLNFGYEYDGDKLTLYVHSAREGRKVRAFRHNAAIAFEMDTGHELVEGNMACQTSYRYKSIIGNGSIHELDDNTEKASALNAMMEHLTGQTFEFNDKMVSAVAVFRIDVSQFSGKEGFESFTNAIKTIPERGRLERALSWQLNQCHVFTILFYP